VSLWDVVRAARAKDTAKLRGWFEGRVVLLGQDRKDDRKANPYQTFRRGGGEVPPEAVEKCDGPPLPYADIYSNMAGVEVHANAVATLLEGRYLREVPLRGTLLVLALVALLVTLSGTFLRGKNLPYAGLAVLVAVVAIPQALFRQGWVVATTELLLTAVLTVIGVFLSRMISAEGLGGLYRNAISVFVSERLTEQIESTGKVSRTGKREQVTILFTDIRGFTAWCESKDPDTVVENLNHYFSAMVPCIVDEGGRVDKFIGDGIMAIFSPEDDADDHHAVRAVRAALKMVTTPMGEFRTGAGIHSGDAVVGAIGSEKKLDFTALGDTVNLASRLEGMNKEFKTRLLMSDETRRLVGDALETVCLGEVQVRGKAEPLKVYTAAELAPKA
jgi:adenylate cyclase